MFGAYPALRDYLAAIDQFDSSDFQVCHDAKRDFRDRKPQDFSHLVGKQATEKGWKILSQNKEGIVLEIFDGAGVAGFSEILNHIGALNYQFRRAVYTAIPGGSHIEIYY